MSDFPLADVYPGLAALPRAGIANLPTPLLDASQIGKVLGVRILGIKFDNLTGISYGGNKVRKLDLILGQALAEKRKAVITFGAYGSNHALATAVYAQKLGLEAHVILTPQVPTPHAGATLLAHAGLGTTIHLADDAAAATRKAVVLRRELTERDGIEPSVIPMGGSSPLGAIGYVNAGFEIGEQGREHMRTMLGGLCKCSDKLVPLAKVYVPAGTLGTAIGLAIGLTAAGIPHQVVAVRVTPSEVANEDIAEKLTTETVALLRSFDPTFPELGYKDLSFALREGAIGEGYAVPTPEAIRVAEIMRKQGVRLETTYSGKALAALVEDAKVVEPGDDIMVFVDTYNSSSLPEPGPVESLPEPLWEYVAACQACSDGTAWRA